MTKPAAKTKISEEGLRYRSKVAGSPFVSGASFGAATMSCFLCGKHRPRSAMKSRKLFGKSQAVCAPACGVPAEGTPPTA